MQNLQNPHIPQNLQDILDTYGSDPMEEIPHKFEPSKENQHNFCRVCSALLAIANQIPSNTADSLEYKLKVIDRLFDWVSRNLWMLERHDRFRLTVQSKLNEFKNDPRAKDIVSKYEWISELTPPFATYTRYGRKVRPFRLE